MNNDPVVGAVYDLARVLMATSTQFKSQADMVRKLTEAGISPSKVALILNMELKAVTSITSRARKGA